MHDYVCKYACFVALFATNTLPPLHALTTIHHQKLYQSARKITAISKGQCKIEQISFFENCCAHGFFFPYYGDCP
jgi:hypothetical protein